ncbi:hypothetical protein [Halopelagius longus]|uniref:DUF2238 domain-containing protein n=1 Tax=Halopelagius longus TaxID=1236180 RepID=A0A1H0YW84_9EURY|nr:hypothetical protein [Halopelagius longus]RDI72704.1 hypothetical protein DWB78_13775 [Halopelagius longus]SDQ19368.1 hypothetical protein SAMN05216278_0875 [Halopelagius longus]
MTRDTRTPAEKGIKGATLAVFVEGFRRRDPNAVVNGVLMFAATFLPDIAERLYDVEFRPWQRAYADAAMLAHAVGMLGPYDETWWWDHVTHAFSATLLGGLTHVVSRRRGRNSPRDVFAAVVGGGLLWEAMEYTVHSVSDRLGIEPVLVYYGPYDTVKDLLFNVVGAGLVVAFGDRYLRNLTEDAD